MYCKKQVSEDSEENVLWLWDNIIIKATLLDLIKLNSVPMPILNLIAEEKGKLSNKWKRTFCSVMKEKMSIQKHSRLFLSLV